ncbi:DUF724 domain-containing protein 6 [Linum perenne]
MVSSIDSDPKAHHHFPLDKQQQQQQQHSPLFRKGDSVEVSSDEEGFVGAWFPATIIDCSASKSISKKRKKVLVRYDTLVNDDGLTPLTESVDPAFVRPFPPAEEKRGGLQFQLNDVVDVRYKDGWWYGVLKKVLEGGKRFRVLFDNPPDFIDCDGSDLRLHWDWVFGKWVRPNKLLIPFSFLKTLKPLKGEELFGLGADVEVNHEKGTVGDTWTPAVVINKNADQTFLVKCQSLDSFDDAVVAATKEDVVVVDSLHIRPSPPCHSRTDYDLLDHVDALIDGSWQRGLITKVLIEGKYTVFFQQRKEDEVFSFSELRPHLDWDHGEWKSKSKVESKGLVVALKNTEKLDSGDISVENLQLAVIPVSPGASYDNIKVKTPSSSTTRVKMDDSTISAEKSVSNVLFPSNKKMKVISDLSGKQLGHCGNLMEGDAGKACLSVTGQKTTSNQSASINQNATSSVPEEETPRNLVISKLQPERLMNAKSSPVCNQLSAKTKKRQANLVNQDSKKIAMVAGTDKESNPENSANTCVKNGEDVLKEDGISVILGLGAVTMSHSSNSSQPRTGDKLNPLGDKKRGSEASGEQNLQKLAGSDGRKRGRPRKYCDINAKMDSGSMSMETSGTDSDGKKMVLKVVSDEVGGQLQLEFNTVPGNELVDKSADVSGIVAETSVVGALGGVAGDDQPLSLWCGGFSSPISAHEDRLSSPSSVNGWHDRKKWQVDPATNASSVSTNSEVSLFVKKSPVWATLESMEIFKNLPQRPHFLPLKTCDEKYREGGAIGILVTFANLIEEISGLTIYDSRSLFENSLKSLCDFEKHGFDVTVPQRRIKKLLMIRNPHMEWLNEAKNGERELDQHVDNKKKLEATVKELEEKILALQQTLAATKGEMEAKEARMTVVQSHVDKMKERIDYARIEFDRLATSPWKLP